MGFGPKPGASYARILYLNVPPGMKQGGIEACLKCPPRQRLVFRLGFDPEAVRYGDRTVSAHVFWSNPVALESQP